MALKSSLSLITRRIGQAVLTAAAGFGLSRGDYALLGTYDEDSDRISLTLGTVRDVDDDALYSAILDEIESALPEIPQFTFHIGLVILHVANLDELYFGSSLGAEHELDLSEMLART